MFKLVNSFPLSLRTDPIMAADLNLNDFRDIQLTMILKFLKELQTFALENSLKFAQRLSHDKLAGIKPNHFPG